jgi:VanZ family protein
VPRTVRFVLLFIWLLVITTTSLISVNKWSSVTVPHLDKAVHFFYYFVLTFLFFGVFNFPKNTKIEWRLAVVFAIFYGIIIEVMQGVLPIDRSPQGLDVVANALGSFTAWFIGIRMPKRLNFKK